MDKHYAELQTLIKENKKKELYIEILDTMLHTTNEWTVVVDCKGKIIMMSKGYKDFLEEVDVIGKRAVDIIDNTRLHIVLETGVREVGEIQVIKGVPMVAMRLPIKKNGKIVGAIGKVMFKNVGDVFVLSKKLKSLENEVAYYKDRLGHEKQAKYSLNDIIGESDEILHVKSVVRRAAKTDSNVLITGESGTGKELFAHAIHNLSKRRLAPFIRINCAAIPSELLESELFGYEDGAFTGAKKGGKKGKFLLANGGTILLDEIGDMPLEMQAKLLRVLQEKEVETIGGSKPIPIDIRIIASTNKKLEKLVSEGRYREDLYYRLNVIRLELPSLRDRQQDIALLANHLRKKLSERLGIYVEGITPEAIVSLESYEWPGNIRELENVVERSINLLESDLLINRSHLPERIMKSKGKSPHTGKTLKETVEKVERQVIIEVLESNGGNKYQTARVLGISRPNLYAKIKAYKICVKDFDM